jgi:hypothetical protein
MKMQEKCSRRAAMQWRAAICWRVSVLSDFAVTEKSRETFVSLEPLVVGVGESGDVVALI